MGLKDSTSELLNEIFKISNKLFDETKTFMKVVQDSNEDERNINEKILQNIKCLTETNLLIGIEGKFEYIYINFIF